MRAGAVIDEVIKTFEQYNRAEREERLLLERLTTNAEGVGSITYGDDTSHGTSTGDRLEKTTITLSEAREKISMRRRRRSEFTADTMDWFNDRLDPYSAWIMKLYCIDCMSTRQVADSIGRSVGWVNQVINKSRKILG